MIYQLFNYTLYRLFLLLYRILIYIQNIYSALTNCQCLAALAFNPLVILFKWNCLSSNCVECLVN